jgi:hypothetical protein
MFLRSLNPREYEMAVHDQRSVGVDFDTCDRLAAVIRNMDVPEHREECQPSGLSRAELADFYLPLVAICHQTQSLRGTIDGKPTRGWDYLNAMFRRAVERDPSLLASARWAEFGEGDLRTLFTDPDVGETLSQPGDRAALLRNLGSVMLAEGWSCFNDLYGAAEARISSGEPNLLGLLARFRAYDDPVRKKSTFLLGLVRNEAAMGFVDEENLLPPVDYHEIRGHLRIGTVVVLDQGLRRKLMDRVEVAVDEDVVIRTAVLEAIRYIAGREGLPDSMRLHYLFWNIFRSVCARESPHCRSCFTLTSLPGRYDRLLVDSSGSRSCPFASVCRSVDTTDRYVEHVFATDWY